MSTPHSPAKAPVLIVDDEPHLLTTASMVLRTAGLHDVATLSDSRQVLPFLQQTTATALLLDLNMPYLSGKELLAQVSATMPDLPVIVMTALNDLDTAVHCMQLGAVDYLVKPVERNRLVSAVKRALELRALRAELLSLKDSLLQLAPLRHPEVFEPIITQYSGMLAVFRYLEAIGPSPQAVLVSGESGTGKELVARALHQLSGRSGPLVAVNVAGLDDQMFSDSLFGHVRGAFTGADRARDGIVANAADGTLFLDEIGDLGTASQVKLLRLLQDGSYYPLGSDQLRQSRARVIVATNVDVPEAVSRGSFRKDLYFRLRTHYLKLPPLRERTGDLPLLLAAFVQKAAEALGRAAPAVPPALLQLLRTYAFPGNLRELESMAFDAVAQCTGSTLSLHSFRDAMVGAPDAPPPAATAGSPDDNPWAALDPLPTLQQAESHLVGEALRRADGNQGVAAQLLGLSRQALNKRLSRQRQASDED